MTTWQRVGAAVRHRREELGLAQGELPPSQATWRKVEHAIDPPYRRSTLVAICRALGWSDDSIDLLLEGDQPRERPSDTVVPPWEELLEGQREITEAIERLADRLEDRST